MAKVEIIAGLYKSVNQEQGLVTAIVLRPNVPDLHGDVYDALEVEKACHNFNVVCRKTNVQHERPADFEIVESYIAKATFPLGEGEVIAGDWVATMKIDTDCAEWEAVKKGEFTGFSIGCVATVEELD